MAITGKKMIGSQDRVALTIMSAKANMEHNEKSLSSAEVSVETNPFLQVNLLKPKGNQSSKSILSNVHPELAKVSLMIS